MCKPTLNRQMCMQAVQGRIMVAFRQGAREQVEERAVCVLQNFVLAHALIFTDAPRYMYQIVVDGITPFISSYAVRSLTAQSDLRIYLLDGAVLHVASSTTCPLVSSIIVTSACRWTT